MSKSDAELLDMFIENSKTLSEYHPNNEFYAKKKNRSISGSMTRTEQKYNKVTISVDNGDYTLIVHHKKNTENLTPKEFLKTYEDYGTRYSKIDHIKSYGGGKNKTKGKKINKKSTRKNRTSRSKK